MIAVNSYPELFTTLLGWQQYQNLWSIVIKTGLAFMPFMFMIVRNTAEPFLSQEAKSAYVISLRRVEFGLVTMILVVMLACQPCMTIDPQVLHFKPVCQPGVDATPGNSGTTYDEAFQNMQPVKVPLWWYGVISLSSGFTASANVGLGCVDNLREEQVQLQMSKIQSAPLRLETKEFVKACWLPSWRKYNEENPDIKSYVTKYGEADPEWPGSHAFLEMPGYYDTFKAQNPIVGFPWEKPRDWVEGDTHGQWGAPTCKDWWQKPSAGLYDSLKNQINPTLWEKIISKTEGTNASDTIIKNLISESETSGYQEDSSMVDQSGGGITTPYIADMGLLWHSLSFYPKMYLLIQALPLVQAYLLMACYVFLAIALPASRYKLSTILSIGFIIFSIIFWSYLWSLAKYVDTAMIHALNPLGGFNLQQGSSKGGTEALTDMVAILMYVALPLFWTMFMGWAGVQVGNGAAGMMDRAAGISGGACGLAGGMAAKSLSRNISKPK